MLTVKSPKFQYQETSSSLHGNFIYLLIAQFDQKYVFALFLVISNGNLFMKNAILKKRLKLKQNLCQDGKIIALYRNFVVF